MSKKRLFSRGTKKYIREQKAQLRRDGLDKAGYDKALTDLRSKLAK